MLINQRPIFWKSTNVSMCVIENIWWRFWAPCTCRLQNAFKIFLPPLMTIKVVSYAHASACCSLRALFLLLPLRIPYVYHTFASHDIFTYIWPVCHSKVTLLEYLIKRQLRLRFCFCFHLLCDYSKGRSRCLCGSVQY